MKGRRERPDEEGQKRGKEQTTLRGFLSGVARPLVNDVKVPRRRGFVRLQG